jgi:hypothetical protein
MEDRRTQILAIQSKAHSCGVPDVPFKAGGVAGLRARGALDGKQARTANRLLTMLRREGAVPYHTAKLAVGRDAFAILEAVIILGEPLSHYARRHGMHHYAASSDLRRALDRLGEHFADRA